MKKKINLLKAVIYGAVAALLIFAGLFYILNHMMPEGPVFLALGIVFAFLTIPNLHTITINDEGVTRTFLGKTKMKLTWSEMREIGIIAENILNRKRARGKTKYIYYSPYHMTPDERLRMVLNWPPKDLLYVSYSPDTLENTEIHWDKGIKTCNVDDMQEDSED